MAIAQLDFHFLIFVQTKCHDLTRTASFFLAMAVLANLAFANASF
jgi:hypothetical protein